MRSLLIISPHFPPTNGADMHRVRTSLRHYREFGWEPRVLAVHPSSVEQDWNDPLLLETIPDSVAVRRVHALSVKLTGMLGMGAIGLRALPALHRAGSRWIREQRPDLVLFSTTAFPVMTLGRLWHRKFGVPYVLDMQDPWVSDLAPADPARSRQLKHRLMRRLHRKLEPFAMSEAGGLMAVSRPYLDVLRQRYPRLTARPCATLTFGASELDWEAVKRCPQPNPFLQGETNSLHGVYVGRGGGDMAKGVRIVFRALQLGLDQSPDLFGRVRLHFIGTDYAPPGREKKTIEPIAAEFGPGVAQRVTETPLRIPYFTAMQVQLDASFLLLVGSEEQEYVPSKLFGSLLACKPLLGVFHEQSRALAMLQAIGGSVCSAFGPEETNEAAARELAQKWAAVLERLPFKPDTDWDEFEPFTARASARRQCALFDEVLATAC
jgi:hypothetical protein